MLFNTIIFGPIKSRRLGTSLGINLLPVDAKICSFNCIYCECGYNFSKAGAHIPSREEVKQSLNDCLSKMKTNRGHLDVITFAGNGEPTLHKDFNGIIEDTIVLRNKYFPQAKVSVLSNATEITNPTVFEALNKVDNNILKLDSACQATLEQMNQPMRPNFNTAKLVESLQRFKGNLIVQTMFLRGEHEGKTVDNTSSQEIKSWLDALLLIKPKQVMIYTIDRSTPAKQLEKLNLEELESIAKQARELGFDVSVSG